MDEYTRMLAFLKIVYQNLTTLHRHLAGTPAWFSIHEEIADWYEKLSDHIDDLVETGLALGYRDPSIKDALLQFGGDLLEGQPRSCEETLRLTRDNLRGVAGFMNAARVIVPPDVQSQLDGYVYEWNKIANYMITRALGEVPGAPIDDDD